MSIDHVLAMKSENHEVLLFDESDEFQASFKNGGLIAGDVFEYTDLQENFWHIQDNNEVLRLLAEARASLGGTLKKAKAG